jgi:EARP and GARP complex-interacting protein 1
MFSSQSTELSLSTPLPALDAVRGDRGSSKFLVGTSSVRASEDNHLHLIQYYPDANQLAVIATWSHPPGPVQQIVTCPTDKSTLLTLAEDVATTTSPATGGTVTLWKIPTDTMMNQDHHDLDDEDEDNDDDKSNQGGAWSPRNDVSAMEAKATLANNDGNNVGTSSKAVRIAWRGGWEEEASSSSQGDVMTLHLDGSLTQWDVVFGSATATRKNHNLQQQSQSQPQCYVPPRMAWDPHHADITAVSMGTMVQILDWRESTMTSSTSAAILSCPHHRYGVTDLDYNPNKPHMLVTSGKDGLIKFWDLRKTSSQALSSFHDETTTPTSDTYTSNTTTTNKKLKKLHPLLVARGGHRHWATRVSYNPFHDQLIVSAGTDSIVNLWRMSTISSAPLVMLEDDDIDDNNDGGGFAMQHSATVKNLEGTTTGTTKSLSSEGPNLRVSQYEHMDSVYAIAWGAADAWIYVSASYDGKVVLNHVPSNEKYKILL